MAVPKRKLSKRRSRSRRAANARYGPPTLRPCPRCKQPAPPHRVCPVCGHYHGREVVAKEE
jgi:large subunit ribosomal protein L32